MSGYLLLILSLIFNLQKQNKTLVVAQDGTGDFKTVHEAFNSIPSDNKKWVTVYIKNGIYKERLVLDSAKSFVKLVGENKETTFLTFDNYSGKVTDTGDTINTYTSASIFILSNDFIAENISFQNDAGFSAGQAVAVFAYGDRLKFKNCKFLGFQDVLFCSKPGARQYYEDCYIEGTTDFIFGPATAVFKSCHIHSKKNSHITAASTPKQVKYGFVFFDCKLTAENEVDKVTLGRPWRPYSSVTYIRCEMEAHIIPEGWNNWRNPENEKTVRYAEYKSFGAGTSPARYAWIKLLSDEEAKEFRIKNIFGDWNPERY